MKYELTSETMTTDDGVTLHRIRARKAFGDVKPGDLGGWIETEDNLSHEGDAWVYGNAQVSGNAQVYGNAKVYGNAQVSGNARVFGDVCLARLICVNRSDGYTFSLLPMSDGSMRISAGCRFFSFEEARDHWTRTRGGTSLGDETMLILDYLERASVMLKPGHNG